MDPVAPEQPSSWLSPEARPGTSSVLPCSSSSRGIRASTRPGAIQVVVKATATMCHLGRGAHLPGEPSLGSLCREMPWRGSDHVSFGGVGRLGKFSPAVNHPTRHPRARRRRERRSRTFSGTVTTVSGVGCPPVGHEVCTHHTNRTALDRRTCAPGRAGHGPAGRAGAAPSCTDRGR